MTHTSSVDRILDIIDAGLQSTTEDGYGFSNDQHPDRCARCQYNPPVADGDLCDGCRSFLLGDTDENPAETAPTEVDLASALVWALEERTEEDPVSRDGEPSNLQQMPPPTLTWIPAPHVEGMACSVCDALITDRDQVVCQITNENGFYRGREVRHSRCEPHPPADDDCVPQLSDMAVHIDTYFAERWDSPNERLSRWMFQAEPQEYQVGTWNGDTNGAAG